MAVVPPSSQNLSAFKSLSTVADVAAFLNTTTNNLFFHLYSRKRPQYHVFFVPKASGGQRRISSPPPVVAFFQQKLLSCMSSCVEPKKPVHGFTAGRSVVTNAQVHLDSELILNIDLLDFFPTFHFGRVRGMFASRPFNFPQNVATVLAQLCCFNRTLPQGACTSPIISNLICRGLDRDLARLAKNHECRYSRYVDDITFSTKSEGFPKQIVAISPTVQNLAPTLGSELQAILDKHAVKLNPAKSRIRRKNERQEVTGILVNEKINVPRSFIRNIRSILRDCEVRGTTAAEAKFLEIDKGKARLGVRPTVLQHLRGKLDFLKMVRGADDAIYSRLAIRTEKISPIKEYGVRLFGQSLKDIKLLGETVWVLIGQDSNGDDLSNGTAFTLDSIGIVSARHTFEKGKDAGACRWILRNAAAPMKEHVVTGYRADPHLDLAIIESQAPKQAALCSENVVCQGDEVRVVGFPDWYTTADQLSVQPGNVTQIKTVQGVHYISTSVVLRGGGSGGPML